MDLMLRLYWLLRNLEDLGRFDLVVVLCWLLGFMDLIAGDMGLVEIWVWDLVLCSRD